MKFLVDECLHLSLTVLLHTAGYEAHHDVMRRVRDDAFVFITNNASDFLDLHSREEVHPGLIIIIPNVKPEIQRALLNAGLRHIGMRTDLINKVIEIDLNGDEIEINEFDVPDAI